LIQIPPFYIKKKRNDRFTKKVLRSQIELLNPSFLKKIEQSLNENWANMASIEVLRIATENLLRGRRSKEWKLRSQLDL
jgi:hypothetical protein